MLGLHLSVTYVECNLSTCSKCQPLGCSQSSHHELWKRVVHSFRVSCKHFALGNWNMKKVLWNKSPKKFSLEISTLQIKTVFWQSLIKMVFWVGFVFFFGCGWGWFIELNWNILVWTHSTLHCICLRCSMPQGSFSLQARGTCILHRTRRHSGQSTFPMFQQQACESTMHTQLHFNFAETAFSVKSFQW